MIPHTAGFTTVDPNRYHAETSLRLVQTLVNHKTRLGDFQALLSVFTIPLSLHEARQEAVRLGSNLRYDGHPTRRQFRPRGKFFFSERSTKIKLAILSTSVADVRECTFEKDSNHFAYTKDSFYFFNPRIISQDAGESARRMKPCSALFSMGLNRRGVRLQEFQREIKFTVSFASSKSVFLLFETFQPVAFIL